MRNSVDDRNAPAFLMIRNMPYFHSFGVLKVMPHLYHRPFRAPFLPVAGPVEAMSDARIFNGRGVGLRVLGSESSRLSC